MTTCSLMLLERIIALVAIVVVMIAMMVFTAVVMQLRR